MLVKTFQFRMYPTKKLQRLLERQLEECRWLWNTLLAERKQAWEERQESLDFYAQKASLPGLKADERPLLRDVQSHVLQDMVLRLKSIADAARGQFLALIACNAAGAGRRFSAENPAYASQDCSRCGARKSDLRVGERVYQCPSCRLAMDRDGTAALHVLARGRARLASAERPLA
jgi:transposase